MLDAFFLIFYGIIFFRKKKFLNSYYISTIKIKDKNHHLAIAIKEKYSADMKANYIVSLFHISKQSKQLNHKPIKTKRWIKITKIDINMIVNKARDKPIKEKKVSS